MAAGFEQIYAACADVLVLAVQLPGAANLPPAPELRQRITAALDDMVNKGRTAGVPDADLAEARYALVAFIDEQILKSKWAGRQEWMNQPLQLLLYREYTAGENFFARMRALLQRGAPSLGLEVYYLCLALGFRGAYGVTGDVTAVSKYAQAAWQVLARALPTPSKLAPNAEPKDRATAARGGSYLALVVAGACLVLIAIALIGLHFSLTREVEQATRAMPGNSATPAP
jgi:type VI secretion system protein ImpK